MKNILKICMYCDVYPCIRLLKMYIVATTASIQTFFGMFSAAVRFPVCSSHNGTRTESDMAVDIIIVLFSFLFVLNFCLFFKIFFAIYFGFLLRLFCFLNHLQSIFGNFKTFKPIFNI